MTKRVAIFIADGTEPVEALAPADALRRGNVEVTLVSVMPTTEVIYAQDIRGIADAGIDEIEAGDFDLLVVPGGSVGVENLSRSAKLADALRSFMAEDRLVGSICAGPMVLNDLGLLEGRKVTCYPGCETGFPAGSYQDVRGVVIDGNLITASGPGLALDFGIALLRALQGDAIADEVKGSMLIR